MFMIVAFKTGPISHRLYFVVIDQNFQRESAKTPIHLTMRVIVIFSGNFSSIFLVTMRGYGLWIKIICREGSNMYFNGGKIELCRYLRPHNFLINLLEGKNSSFGHFFNNV